MLGGTLKLVKAVEEEHWQLADELLVMIRPASKMDVVYDAMYESRAYADDVFSALSLVTDSAG